MSKISMVIQTVLGSCVSVCIWDKVLAYGGVNHFKYPVVKKKEDATPVYGNVATISLVKMMEEIGCCRQNLIAHIMGGAHPEGRPDFKTGQRNIEIARKVLSHCGVKVVSEDTGGVMGRKVLFDTDTGHVAVLKVHKLRDSDWYQ